MRLVVKALFRVGLRGMFEWVWVCGWRVSLIVQKSNLVLPVNSPYAVQKVFQSSWGICCRVVLDVPIPPL